MNAPLKASWLDHPERGSRSATRFMTWLALRCGRSVARLLLVPICGYFLAFSPRARSASRQYLEFALGRPPRSADIWRHFFTFATTVLDRVYFIDGWVGRFDIELRGLEALHRTLARGRGCLLLGAHLGSFDLLRVVASEHRLPVSVVMYEENAANITEALNARLDPVLRERIIVSGEPDTTLRIADCLSRGELVGMLGDRAAGSDKTVTCRFFRRDAVFPEGPLRLAVSLRVPVYLIAGLYEGGRRYVVHLEPFCEEPSADRAERTAWTREWAQRYAERLEHFCRMAPYNWFNFYDFWSGSPR
ncbi:MAG TPA: acyl-CoA synthetase [Burkholderiales bacterium]